MISFTRPDPRLSPGLMKGNMTRLSAHHGPFEAMCIEGFTTVLGTLSLRIGTEALQRRAKCSYVPRAESAVGLILASVHAVLEFMAMVNVVHIC